MTALSVIGFTEEEVQVSCNLLCDWLNVATHIVVFAFISTSTVDLEAMLWKKYCWICPVSPFQDHLLWNDTCHYDKHARSNCAWINADSSEANFVDWAILIIVQNSPSCCAPASLWFFDEILANILITIILLLFSVCSPKSQNSRCFLQKVLTVSPVSDLRVYWISSPASSIWETLSSAKARKEKLISPQSLR